jgi:hypothetical protein
MNAEKLMELHDANDDPIEVTVIANDYRYDGWLVMIGPKRSGAVRCVVEDSFGRLFIHHPTQIRQKEPAQR